MTNFDYIMENITVRDISLAMRLTGHGFATDTLFGKAWYACQRHYKKCTGYSPNITVTSEGAVNPFIHSQYLDDKLNLVNGHSRINAYETWLAKQYNPEEWD